MITARPPAKMGAIVESTPADKTRLAPKTTKTDRRRNEGDEPSLCGDARQRAVATCSSTAMAVKRMPARDVLREPGRSQIPQRPEQPRDPMEKVLAYRRQGIVLLLRLHSLCLIQERRLAENILHAAGGRSGSPGPTEARVAAKRFGPDQCRCTNP